VKLSKGMLLLLGVFWVNVLGSIYGYYFYQPQFSRTPVALWPFVPDCPLYTTLFALVIVLAVMGYRNTLFNFIVSVGLMKYAAWTLMVLVMFKDFYFFNTVDIAMQAAILFIMHVGMFLEGLTFPFPKPKPWHLAAALGWFLLNDIIDYFGPAVHPFLPPGASVAYVMGLTFLATFAFAWLAWSMSSKGKRIGIGI